ncbi:MAG: hypothetical protein ACRD0P_35075, partial [Stackebrandtia sp.]
VSDMDGATRLVRENEEKIATATGRLTEQERQLRQDRIDQEARRTAIGELRRSEAYQQGSLVDERRQQAEQAERDAAREHTRLTKQEQQLAVEQTALHDADSALGTSRDRSAELAKHSADVANEAGMPALHTELAALVDTGYAGQAATMLRAGVSGRNQQIDEVSRAITAHRNAVDQRDREEDRRDRAQQDHEASLAETERRRQDHQRERDRLAEAVEDWARDCTELSFPDAIVDQLLELVDSRADLRELVHRVAEAVSNDLTRDEIAATQLRDTLRPEHQTLRTDLEALRRQRVVAPEPPRTRTATRDGRPGAPLWQLIRFCADGAAVDQGAVEAALEAAGLLDAWVNPHGQLDIDGHDSFIVDPGQPVSADSLLSILEPE